jgi:hypothetical protein
MNNHLYEYTYVHPISISISERLRRFDFEIHEIDHQERLGINGDITYHRKNN